MAGGALPTISGADAEGQTLTATTGEFYGSGMSYSYQWQDCSPSGTGCAPIPSATASSYALAPTDVGYEVDVVVTATNAHGSADEASAATG